MDVILYNKLQKLDGELNDFKVETQESSVNLVTFLAGYDFANPIITENKIAYYSMAQTVNFSGANLVEFDVNQVVKFKYLYALTPSDSRGLHFVDKNGIYISGLQAVSSQQNVTVPNGAAKCFATVNSIYDIEIYDIVAERPVEILKEQAAYNDKDSGGISYTWNQNHTKLTIKGTRTSTSYDKMAGGSSTIPIGIEPGKKYKFVINAKNPAIILACTLYKDGNNTGQKPIYSTQVWQVPDDITGMDVRVMVTGSGAVVDETIDCPEIYTLPEFKSITEQIGDLNDFAYGNDENPLAYVHKEAGLLSVFHTVGCIGDSLASGASAYKESGVTKYHDDYNFSWGQCLARLTGNTYYNFSKGGLSSRSWLESTYATECFDGNHKCDAYFIGLGQNDKNGSIPVGTIADIDLSDYTQNADTYCGNMGKIIQKVQELQPKAPLFVFIDPNPPSNDQSYNDVIDDIVALFDNVWIIDLKTYARQMFTDPSYIIGSQYRGGHYSAVGYQEIAYVIATYVDWIIKHNLSDFKQVEYIGTNYEWTD